MKFSDKNYSFPAYVGSLAIVLIGFLMQANAVAEVLITSKEAGLPQATQHAATRGISRGPAIKFIAPMPNASINSPFDLKVVFEPRGESRIEVNSIKVTYLKSPYIDLTPRLKSAISANGINLQNAEVPPGDHLVRLSVQDSEGRETNAVLNLVINK